MVLTEKEHIRTLIEAKKLKISCLASQIQEFTRMREAEINELAALQMMISPIGHLPIELLAEIFDLHVPGESFSQDSPLDDTPAIVEAALRVSQVCRHWRQIAHSTPRLWVDGFRLAIDQEPTELDFAQTSAWLERSQPLPITVYVFRGSNDPLTESLKRTRIFKALLSAAGRWKHLIWDIPFLSPLLDIVPGTLVALETFAIEDIHVQPAERILDIFMTAPRLRRVNIEGGRHPGLPFSSFLMPWNQLTTLKLQSTGSLNECRQIMLQCTNLVAVTLHSLCGWYFSEGSPSSPIVVLPFLEDIQISFTLEEEGFSRIEPFFAPLPLPALKTLKIEIEICDVEFSWDAGKFSEFQDRAPNIEKLTFELDGDDNTDMDADSLITLLRHSPTLTDLSIELRECGIDDTFFHALQLNENDSRPLVPRLRRLALLSIGSRPSDRAVEAMVGSRWWIGTVPPLPGIARLQSLNLRRTWRYSEDSGLSEELRTSLREIQGRT